MNFQTAPQAGDGSPAVASRPSSTRERATLSLRALRQPGAHAPSGAGLDPLPSGPATCRQCGGDLPPARREVFATYCDGKCAGDAAVDAMRRIASDSMLDLLMRLEETRG